MSDLAPDRDAAGSDPALTPAVGPIRWSRVGPVAVIASLVLAFALAGPRFWHSVRSEATSSVAVEALPPTTHDALGGQLPTERAPQPQAGQVAVLGRFAARDPFAAPASVQSTPPPPAAPVAPAAVAPAASVAPASAGDPAATPAPSPGITPAPATTAAATTAQPAADPAASTVTLSVNGVAEQVAVKGLFPAADPIFRLAALGASSVQISVAGGATPAGDQTVTLAQGRALTLIDTASGARYELRLLGTPASPATDVGTAAPAAATAPPATTTLP